VRADYGKENESKNKTLIFVIGNTPQLFLRLTEISLLETKLFLYCLDYYYASGTMCYMHPPRAAVALVETLYLCGKKDRMHLAAFSI